MCIRDSCFTNQNGLITCVPYAVNNPSIITNCSSANKINAESPNTKILTDPEQISSTQIVDSKSVQNDSLTCILCPLKNSSIMTLPRPTKQGERLLYIEPWHG